MNLGIGQMNISSVGQEKRSLDFRELAPLTVLLFLIRGQKSGGPECQCLHRPESPLDTGIRCPLAIAYWVESIQVCNKYSFPTRLLAQVTNTAIAMALP